MTKEEYEALYEDWVFKCEVISRQQKIIEDAAQVLRSIFADEDRGLLESEATILHKINDYLKLESNEL